MILDTSAIIAILFQEPGYETILSRIAESDLLAAGTPTLTEAGIVLTARVGQPAAGLLGRFLEEFRVLEIPFGEQHWREAVSAFAVFGKGRHPAALNFGDCMTYATAKLSNQPLAFVGEDFRQTDLLQP